MANYPYYQQPIMNPYQQMPTVQPYQDRLAQLQNNYQQVMPYGQVQQPVQQIPQTPMLLGQMVDGIDTVKAKDVDMSGNPVYYPKTDGTEIYRKQLQADGRSKIFVYRLSNPDEQQQEEPKQVDLVAMINQLRSDVCAEISGIKDLLSAQMSGTSDSSRQQNGGKQR